MCKMVLIVVVLGLLVLFYVKDPASSWYLVCPFKAITGYDCPGCGGQRALHQLLHLNFKNAFLLNPLLVISSPLVIISLVFNLKFFRENFGGFSQLIFSNKAFFVILFLILFFFIFRNTEIYLSWIEQIKRR